MHLAQIGIGGGTISSLPMVAGSVCVVLTVVRAGTAENAAVNSISHVS